MAPNKCVICGTTTEVVCAGCKAAHYCSVTCQKEDRPLHKLLCRKYTAFLKTRPAPKKGSLNNPADLGSVFYFAILFPESSKLPKLVWLECKRTTRWKKPKIAKNGKDWIPPPIKVLDRDAADLMGVSGQMMMFLGGTKMKDAPGFGLEDHECHQSVSILEALMPPHFKMYPHPDSCLLDLKDNTFLEIFIGDESRTPSAEKNQCMASMNIGYEVGELGFLTMHSLDIGGDCVVVNTKVQEKEWCGLKYKSQKYMDATLAHLRCAVDLFARRNKIYNPNVLNPYIVRKKEEWMRAVVISCEGDMKFLGEKKFKGVYIHKSYFLRGHEKFVLEDGPPIFRGMNTIKTITSNIAHSMNVPLEFAKLPINPILAKKAKEQPDFDPFDNFEASLLAPGNKSWRSSVLVGRLDRVDLTPPQIEAIVSYLVNLFPGPDKVDTARAAGHSKAFRVEYFYSSRFEEYLEELKKAKVAAGEEDCIGVVPFRIPWTETDYIRTNGC